ncbi:hypothetical protein QE363_003424 [Sphingomonas sp. SORGH_AS870]|uniref:hypothetical protein n=1 Tax=Sphingomonas sp. SORGH_AS_0870 TaxID=3041801 RepID=UPI00285ECF35|nr:hypothetical protein [Sphingomonas sp. SORGH_AS_0870]MDR6147631.1 hypothetical protein [Sphingomonas sp. SORGH_AS_0870]
MPVHDADLDHRLARLERKYRIAFTSAAIASVCSVLAIAGAVGTRAGAAITTRPDSKVTDVLRVRELNIVDQNGVTRVKIGAPLPHAVINGHQLKSRGGRPEDTMSGILLFDAQGNERSGYATVDHGYSNVLLTLDDQTKQHAMFIAEPTGATTLRLFNADTKDRVDVGIDEKGPHISMMKAGKEIYRFPAN